MACIGKEVDCASRREGNVRRWPDSEQDRVISCGLSIEPFDDQYQDIRAMILPYFSPYALRGSMVVAETLWLEYYLELNGYYVRLDYDAKEDLLEFFEKIRSSYNKAAYAEIKAIERATKDPVQAVTQYVKEKLRESGYSEIIVSLNTGCTSQEITSAAYAVMVQDTLNCCWGDAAERLAFILECSEDEEEQHWGKTMNDFISTTISQCSQVISKFGRGILGEFPDEDVDRKFIENELMLAYGSEEDELSCLSKLMSKLQYFLRQLEKLSRGHGKVHTEVADGILDGVRKAKRKDHTDFYQYQSVGLAFAYSIKAIYEAIDCFKQEKS